MSTKTKWTKVLGTAGKLIAIIPDTTEIIGRAIDNTRPIVEKELDRHNERRNAYIHLDDVVHLDITDAKQHLEEAGFVVREIIALPEAKYATATVNQVIAMSPSSKKARKGALIKLYYLDQEAINASSIIAQEKAKKAELFNRKIAEGLAGAGNFFSKSKKEKKPRKDVTPK